MGYVLKRRIEKQNQKTMAKKKEFKVQDVVVRWNTIDDEDYISLTDIAKGDRFSIYSWMKNRNTIELLIGWEQLYNPHFNRDHLDTVRKDISLNSYRITPKKWIELTGSIGILAKSGRHGAGTWAHIDIAVDFAAWLDPIFRLYLIKEFRRLKEEESDRLQLDWNANRFISKRNYALHTDSIKQNLLPQSIYETEDQWIEYASEADLLNRAVFGTTSKAWREANPDKAQKGNMRDYANTIQLLVLSNLEAINAELIRESLPKEERFERLCTAALHQFGVFYRDQNLIDKGLK